MEIMRVMSICPHDPMAARALSTAPSKLAKHLANKLTNLNDKGKQKGQEDESDSEAKRLASMRAVNGTSQTLSNVVQSGKKLTGGTVSRTTLNTVVFSTAEVAKHLGVLRWISPGDIDVERAALIVLGQLLVLEVVPRSTT